MPSVVTIIATCRWVSVCCYWSIVVVIVSAAGSGGPSGTAEVQERLSATWWPVTYYQRGLKHWNDSVTGNTSHRPYVLCVVDIFDMLVFLPHIW